MTFTSSIYKELVVHDFGVSFRNGEAEVTGKPPQTPCALCSRSSACARSAADRPRNKCRADCTLVVITGHSPGSAP
ncbi:hypothetical protein SAMN05421507_12317 [Lentzea jiangxiensis]|uniref:Uncharacterized protein n=1 Tax=Lentzea jiangxiensis TaxID=641025 RepID=A0A1H0WTY2_9PSEU|nr:hypothetical protein SAMN05421507_12317 [Lentzea jiangxiensis]